jgi:hypothetical protein
MASPVVELQPAPSNLHARSRLGAFWQVRAGGLSPSPRTNDASHDISLITTIAAALGMAMVTGFVASRLSMPPLVGYLLAGIVIGPATPGFVADVALAGQLAEIGVMLLMFGVGLHFSLDDLLAVRRIAVPVAIVQIVVATAMGMATAMAWGWSFGAALVFGLALSVASTVVLLRALETREAVERLRGAGFQAVAGDGADPAALIQAARKGDGRVCADPCERTARCRAGLI